MNQLSDRLNSLSPSATLAMSQKSAELKAQGVDVINLSVGEPDFNTPDHIKEAAKKAIDDNFSRYSPVPGYPALRNAIVEKLKKENGLDYTVAQISCANGAKQSVCNAILVLVNPGDEVIVPAPYWVSYPEMVKLAEGKPVIVTAGIEQDFKITPAQLEAAITPKTKALILCSPSNPTGSVYSKEELAGLVAVLAKHPQVIVIADEIYEHINYIGKHQSIAQFPEMKDRTVIVNGVSKAYAMTGWRLGYMAGPRNILSRLPKLQENMPSCLPEVVQYAGIEALKNGTYEPKPVRRTYIKKKNGKMRPLGLPAFTDKLVQDAIRMVLQAIYEPVFSDYSHGFRPGRSCHTALTQMKHEFVGAKWFVEGDIKGCFDNIDHMMLIAIIIRKIKDVRFVNLIRLFLKAGYMEDWKYYGTYSGCPQGGILSPILANIYLNELDKFVETLKKSFDSNTPYTLTPEYKAVQQKRSNTKKKI